MARCLIIGCGCRGRGLAAALLDRGHVVRGTSRDSACLPEIEAVGAEPVVADPDRVITLIPAFAHVTIAYILLGSATGTPEQVRALHETRLEMMLFRMLDTTIRGIVYEAAGSVDDELLHAGAARVRSACEESRIPYRLLETDPADRGTWLATAAEAADSMLSGA